MTEQFSKKAEAWSARFSEPVSDLVKRYTASVFFDKRLAPHDIEGSLAHAELRDAATGESSAVIGARVAAARHLQLARQDKANHVLSTVEIDRYCRPDQAGEDVLQLAMQRLNWSARAYHRVLKVARTIADLAGAETIGQAQVSEAIQYRRALRER